MSWAASINAKPVAPRSRLAALGALYVTGLLTLGCDPGAGGDPPAKSAPPNILLIVADDLGYGDVGAFGNPQARTPRLDELAEAGTRFTRFYSAGDTCSPTRASLLTGLYPQRLGAYVTPRALPEEVQTLPELLRQAGYATHHVGKWHLGVSPDAEPVAHGFDTFFGFLHALRLNWGGSPYQNPRLLTGEEKPRQLEGHLTDLLTERAIEAIRSGREGQPWFLNLWYLAPHDPVMPPQRWADRETDDPRGRYHALVSALDENIGRVLDALDETNQADNTLVVFMSDNGAVAAESNLPLFGAKTRLFEGGVRVPMILRVPWLDTPAEIGRPTISMDLLPTLAAFAGAEPLDPIDGFDLSPLLGAESTLPERVLFWEASPFALGSAGELEPEPAPTRTTPLNAAAFSVLSADGRWRLTEDQGRALFDLAADPTGHANVLRDHPAVGDALVREYRAWAKAVRRVPVRAAALGTARWDGHQADFAGQGRVDLEGYDVLRAPDAGAWTFGVGVMPARPAGNPSVIAAQAGVWSLERESSGELVLRMGEAMLRANSALPVEQCTPVSVSSLRPFAGTRPKLPGRVELWMNGSLVASSETNLQVASPARARPTTLGNSEDGVHGFFGALLNPTFLNVARTDLFARQAAAGLCQVHAGTEMAEVAP